MDEFVSEVSYFRCCRTFDGGLAPVELSRRNGRLAPRFNPSITGLPECVNDASESSEFRELLEEVCQNLNSIEQRTWLRLLDGRSILDIAVEDNVSRTAIYERIRGSSKGYGGMVAKNPYVAIWWRLRREEENGR